MEKLGIEAAQGRVWGIFILAVFLGGLATGSLLISHGNSDLWSYPILIFGLLFFGIEAFYLFNMFIRNKSNYILEFSEEGVTDHSLSYSPGLIPWAEVKGIESRRFFGTDMLGITIDRHRTYYRNISFYKRMVIVFNRLLKFPHVCIAINRTNYSSKEVQGIAEKYKEYYSA